jgi:hypothetical protein
MSKEIPQQYDMFTGELIDTRSKQQIRQETKPIKATQTHMFAPREVLQFGVKSNPSLPAMTSKGLPIGMQLEIQDPRTDDEKEYDRMKAAEAATYKLFEPQQPVEPVVEIATKSFPSGLRFELRLLAGNNGEESIPAIHIDEGFDLPFWANRDEGFEWADIEARRKGYIPHFAGDVHLELRKVDNSGSFTITYSRLTDNPMSQILNVIWRDEI